MTHVVGLANASADREMLVRQTKRAATRDAIDRIADEHIARPDVELVHVRPPLGEGTLWRADIYSNVSNARPNRRSGNARLR